MKKKLIIALSLILLLLAPAPALAYEPWDVEDPCVVANEDFIAGGGFDGGVPEFHSGGQPWAYGKNPNEGYSLYRDDATDTGNLDQAFILTYTPGAVDLPVIAEYWSPATGAYWYMGDASSDSWYWALEPRGYNLSSPPQEAYNRYKGLSGVFWVEVLNFSGFDTYKWDDWGSFDRVLAEPVVAYNRVNGLICTLYIPEGTHLSFPGRPYTLVTNLFVEKDDSGGVYLEPGNMDFSQPCSLKLAHPDGTEEIVTFTQIRDGLPME